MPGLFFAFTCFFFLTPLITAFSFEPNNMLKLLHMFIKYFESIIPPPYIQVHDVEIRILFCSCWLKIEVGGKASQYTRVMHLIAEVGHPQSPALDIVVPWLPLHRNLSFFADFPWQKEPNLNWLKSPTPFLHPMFFAPPSTASAEWVYEGYWGCISCLGRWLWCSCWTELNKCPHLLFWQHCVFNDVKLSSLKISLVTVLDVPFIAASLPTK